MNNLPTYILMPSRRHERKEMYVQYGPEFHLRPVFQFGAVPLIVPSMTEALPHLDHFLDMGAGLLLFEGKDVHPDRYGPTDQSREYVRSSDVNRDAVEFYLAEAAFKRGMPVFGICRGSHLMNIVSGGDMWTDVHADRPEKSINHIDYENYHSYRHQVDIEPGTWLADLYDGAMQIPASSYHHQAVKTLAERFEPMAYCVDGVLEAFRDPSARFAVGVQFHPERMQGEHDGHTRIYEEFITAAHAYKQEKLTIGV